MPSYMLEFTLLSETCFGSGVGVAGMVDAEIQHDESGLPTVSGRALKGMLVNECADLLFALESQGEVERWQKVAQRLFGARGETEDDHAGMVIGNATLAPDLVAALHSQLNRPNREEILESLTVLRQQTSIDAVSGAPKDETLRTSRLIMQGMKFYAPLWFEREPSAEDKALLAASVRAWRRAGLGRTRGRGRMKAEITDASPEATLFAEAGPNILTSEWFEIFKQEVAK